MMVTLELAARDEPFVREWAHAVSDPDDARFGCHLEPAALEAHLGWPEPELADVRADLAAHGWRALLTGSGPCAPLRFAVEGEGELEAGLGRAAALQLLAQRRLDGERCARWLPGALARIVRHVELQRVREATGWSVRRLEIPRGSAVRWPDHGLRPADVRAGYGFPADAHAEGETIAILALGGLPRPDDLGAFWSAAGVEPPTVDLVTLGPLSPSFDRPLPRLETTMNVQWVGAMAPRARIVVYLVDPAHTVDPWAAFLSAILADHPRRPTVAVTTWSAPERQYYRTHGRERIAELLDRAAARGITIVAATGDWGAYDGNPSAVIDTPDRGPVRVCERLECRVGFPAVESRVLAVGGTHVTSVQPWRESAWSAAPSTRLAREIELPMLAGGGGFSDFVPIPAWQRSVLRTAHPRSHGEPAVVPRGRGIPDVSLVAWGPDHIGASEREPASAVIVVDGEARCDGGGTSLAAPIWAAIVACINGARRRTGAPRLGCANALLYRMAHQHEGCLRGVARGATDIRLPVADADGRATEALLPGFVAHPGWNPATGLGVPDLTRTIAALCSNPGATNDP